MRVDLPHQYVPLHHVYNRASPMIVGVVFPHGVDLVWQALLLIALAGSFTSTIYLAMTLVATSRYLGKAQKARESAQATPASSLPPVTIFKPIHGAEEKLA